MKKTQTLLTGLIVSSLLVSCANDGSPFTEGGDGASSGTNIVSEKNFNVAFDPVRPLVIDNDGNRFTGIESIVTITAADQSGLPTTGATVFLDVDWGILSATSCIIESTGKCSITWTGDANFNQPFFPDDAEITFTAWALGEESYIDLNDNGVFDDADGNALLNDTSGPFLNLNHSAFNSYEIGEDKVLVPGNIDGILTAADNLFNGTNCTHSTLCSSTTVIYVSDQAIIRIDEEPPAIP